MGRGKLDVGREAPGTWSWERYLDGEELQELRHELVDGGIVVVGGGTAIHDTIANNLRAELRDRLRGGPGRAQGADLKLCADANGR